MTQAVPERPVSTGADAWKRWKGKHPIWCPGCGDFGVLTAMQKAAQRVGLDPDQTVLVTGIGCSGNITAYFRSFGIHGIHGRSLPLATGIKAARPDLTVLAAGGDGDGFGIGIGHFLHAARRNVDVSYIVMDNQVYGLTKGQTSPTTPEGMTTKASPSGPMAQALQPLELAIAAGASFVAQGFAGDPQGLVALIEQAVRHRGFSLVLVQSPCVTYNHVQTYEWFRTHQQAVPPGHDVGDRDKALALARGGPVPMGLLYRVQRPVWQEARGDLVQAAADPAGAAKAHAAHYKAWSDGFLA